jgi:hypothetical protein
VAKNKRYGDTLKRTAKRANVCDIIDNDSRLNKKSWISWRIGSAHQSASPR